MSCDPSLVCTAHHGPVPVGAATAGAVERGLPNRWLVGRSFGAELVLEHGAVPPVADRVEGGDLLSPPLHRAGDADLDHWAEAGEPLRVLVPEHDDFRPPEEAARRSARVPQAELTGVDDAEHLRVGEGHVHLVLEEIATTVLGEPVSLPGTWGPTASGARDRRGRGVRGVAEDRRKMSWRHVEIPRAAPSPG